jgi:hypothetical protein
LPVNMKHARVRITRKAKPADIDDNPDPDDQVAKKLVDALAPGQLSWGDLRRIHGIQPTPLVRVLSKFQDLFSTIDIGGKPHSRLLIAPLDAILAISKRGMDPKHSTSLDPFQEIRPPAVTKTPTTKPDDVLKASRDRLIKLLEFSRYSPFLESHGFGLELLRAINLGFPGLIVIENNLLGQSTAFRVSLVGSEKTEEPEVVVAAPSKQPPAPFPVTDAELERMKWRPGRNVGVRSLNEQCVRNRTRRPLVQLPQ